MKAGMIIRSKQATRHTDHRRWFIKKEGELKRHTKNKWNWVKGYRVAPLSNLEHGFWVTEEQLHERFEEVV